MNIAYISADFGVPIFGHKGASVHVREMIAALRRAGHTVCVCSPAMEREEDEAFLAVPPAMHHLQAFKELEGLDTFFFWV
jgi:hypothetical protein